MPMSVKSHYTIDGQRWLRIGAATTLLGTNGATIKKWMGDGTLEWRQLRDNSPTLLVSERDVLHLRANRDVARKETAKRAAAATRSADETGRSMRRTAPPSGYGSGVFTRTWDPAPLPLPISGRDKPDPNRP